MLQPIILPDVLKTRNKAFSRSAKDRALLLKPVSMGQTQQERKKIMLIFPRSWQVLTQMGTIQEHIHQANYTNSGRAGS